MGPRGPVEGPYPFFASCRSIARLRPGCWHFSACSMRSCCQYHAYAMTQRQWSQSTMNRSGWPSLTCRMRAACQGVFWEASSVASIGGFLVSRGGTRVGGAGVRLV